MKKRVLVIEDNDNNMKLITFILHNNGYDTVEAKTGQAGIDTFLKSTFHFIVLDIQLPDMSGLDVLMKIRSYKEEIQIPIIAMTSYAMSGDRAKIIGAGCNGYVEKPIDPLTVMDEINKAIGENI